MPLSPPLPRPLPAMNAEPEWENWMITGELSLAAASITPLIVFDPVQLAAGRANCSALARAKTSLTSAPVMTPGANSRRISVMLRDATRRRRLLPGNPV